MDKKQAGIDDTPDAKQRRRGHGAGSITKLTYGHDQVRYQVRITVEGKRRTFYAATEREANALRKQKVREREQGKLQATPSQSVRAYLDAWLVRARESIRPRTYENYVLNVERVAPYIGSIQLEALKPAHIQDLYAKLQARGLSKRSVEQAHAVLHKALHDAVRLQEMLYNPTDAAIVPRPDHHEMKTLTREQVQILLDATSQDRLHGLWATLALLGLRVGEAVGLKWSDVELTAGRLTVRRTLQCQKGVGLVFAEPKSQRSRRTIPLRGPVLEALREHRRRQLAERLQLGPRWTDEDLVFCSTTGGRLDPGNVYESLQRRLKRASLPKVRVHDLRHTAATLLLEAGVGLKEVSDMLGHSTITLTANTYCHVTPAMREDAAEKMAALFTTPRYGS